MSRRIVDTIRGYRITPAPAWRDQRDRGDATPEERARRAALRKVENEWSVKHGLALVMMQELELDENGRREQTADIPNWRQVEKFAKSIDGGD